MNKLFHALFIAILFNLGGSLKAQTIDTDKSRANFSISNMKIGSVLGSFSEFSGTSNFDTRDITKSSFEISIPVSSIDTKNPKRDAHLQAEEYFNAGVHPNITFKSAFVNPTAIGLDITGKLNIKGTEKTVTIPFRYETTEEGYLLKGNFVLDRYDFKVGGKGSFAMGREVKLEILCYLKN